MVSNIFTRTKYEKLKNSNEKLKLDSLEYNSIYKKRLENIQANYYELETHNKQIINSIFKQNLDCCNNEEAIIVYFNEKTCKSCVLGIIMDLEILIEEIGKQNIILVGSFNDEKDFFDFAKTILPNSQKVIVPPIAFKSEKSESPFIFIVDKEKQIKLFFSPEDFPELREKYFSEYLKKYFIEKCNRL
jgi:hypothetical protein